MITDQRLDAILQSPLITTNPELALFRDDYENGKWTLYVGNDFSSIRLGETEGQFQFCGNTLEECLASAERFLLENDKGLATQPAPQMPEKHK